MTEHEIKLMLTPKEHDFLLHHPLFRWKPLFQINHYYDTPNCDFTKKNVTCRIRENDGTFIATTKEHISAEISTERSCAVESLHDDSVFTDIGLICHGCLETWRAYCVLENGLTIMLDENKYLGVRDYELEIEYDESKFDLAHKWLQTIADELFAHGYVNQATVIFERARSVQNKSVRFFEYKLLRDKRMCN